MKMNEQVNDSNAAFMEAALKKIEAQDKKIADMAQQIGSIPDNSQDIQQLKNSMNELKAEIKKCPFPCQGNAGVFKTIDYWHQTIERAGYC